MKNNKITKEDFVHVVEESKELLFRLSYSILKDVSDAEDAVSEAVLKAWERRGQVREKENLRSWLIKIVINSSRSMRSKRERMRLFQMKPHVIPDKKGPSGQGDIWSFITEMKEKHKTVLLLYYYAEYSVREIAKMLHVPEGTVKSRLSRAREELKQLLIQSEYRTETGNQEKRKKGQGEKGHGENE